MPAFPFCVVHLCDLFSHPHFFLFFFRFFFLPNSPERQPPARVRRMVARKRPCSGILPDKHRQISAIMPVRTPPVIIPVMIGLPLPFPMAKRPPAKAHSPMQKLRARLGVDAGSVPDQMRAAAPKTNSRTRPSAKAAPKRICRKLLLRKKNPSRIESLFDPMRKGIFLC